MPSLNTWRLPSIKVMSLCVCVCVCAIGRSVLSINVWAVLGNRSDSSVSKKGKLTFVVKKKKKKKKEKEMTVSEKHSKPHFSTSEGVFWCSSPPAPSLRLGRRERARASGVWRAVGCEIHEKLWRIKKTPGKEGAKQKHVLCWVFSRIYSSPSFSSFLPFSPLPLSPFSPSPPALRRKRRRNTQQGTYSPQLQRNGSIYSDWSYIKQMM